MSDLINTNYDNFVNKNTITPAFKSGNISTPQLKNDVVELSTKVKREEKKFGMSTGMKLLLGIGGLGATIYGVLVTHRAISRPSLEALAKDFSEIFRRDVSKDEVSSMLKEYKELFKINDQKEFCQKAFEQVKKDYGYKDLDIKLTLNETTDGMFGGRWYSNGLAFEVFDKKIMEVMGNEFNNKTKAAFLKIFFHEFQHAKQTEYGVRTSLDKYIKALTTEEIVNRNYSSMIQQILADKNLLEQRAIMANCSAEEFKQFLINSLQVIKTKGYKEVPELAAETQQGEKVVRQRLEDLFGKFEKFKPETKEYKQGEKYIEEFGQYIEANENINKYKTQLIEQEAYKVENMSLNIPERLKSIWNIFDNTKYKTS